MVSKFPRNFLYALIVYISISIWGIVNFILPVIRLGLFLRFIEFALPITILILLPLILLLFYWFDDRFLFIQQHEAAMRTVIIISIVISLIVVFLFTVMI